MRKQSCCFFFVVVVVCFVVSVVVLDTETFIKISTNLADRVGSFIPE